MDETQYRNAVIKMRMHQNAWFRLHKQSDLIEAKKLEHEIDVENGKWLIEQEKKKWPVNKPQETLFDGDGKQ
jgi:hypothetical protein